MRNMLLRIRFRLSFLAATKKLFPFVPRNIIALFLHYSNCLYTICCRCALSLCYILFRNNCIKLPKVP